MTTPRCFIVRHGETEWSLNGRHTGTTDLPLTPNGEKRVAATGRALVGSDRLVVPSQLVHIYVSPRKRAQRTLELLNLGCRERYPWQHPDTHRQGQEDEEVRTDARVEITEDIREWDYGDYEGLTSKEIKKQREERGEGSWDIWRDGCPGGEMPGDISRRLDRLIADIRQRFHAPVIGKSKQEVEQMGRGHGDVLVVGHGHILRAFAMRWIGKSLEQTAFLMEAGGVGTLRYVFWSLLGPRWISSKRLVLTWGQL